MDKKLPVDFTRAFKDADIRGITVSEIDDDLAYSVARAFVEEFRYKKVVVGRDMRVSTPSLAEAFMTGVRDSGADVIDIGMAHSPLLYFASGTMALPGVMITASHSPAEYNGLKLVEPGAVPLTKATGLTAIEKRVQAGKFKTPKKRGSRRVKNVRTAYQSYILKGINKPALEGITIAADIGNGMASVLMPLLEEKLPIKFTSLFSDMDGTFPNHGSDPTIKKHQKQLKAEMLKNKYDFGILFDGDADRIAFLDERGEYVNCAIIGAIIAEKMLSTSPKAGMVFTNLTSRVYEESIKNAGGKALRAKVGHAFLKRKMLETGALFGCEHSGHFFFKEFFNTDSVVLTLRYVLEVYVQAKKNGQSFSEFVQPYQKYQQLEDVVIHVNNKKAALDQVEAFIKKEFPTADIKKFDGLYVTTEQAWGAVKPSVTEHALKVMFEGHKKTEANKLQKELVAYIKTIANN